MCAGSAQTCFPEIPYHSVFGFLSSLLVGILEVYAEGREKNLFETHIANMYIFVLSTVIYCFAFAADWKYEHQETGYLKLSNLVAITLGSLSSTSVASILFGNMVFVPWTILAIIVAYQHANSITEAYDDLLKNINHAYDWIMKIISELSTNWHKGEGSSSTQQPQVQ